MISMVHEIGVQKCWLPITTDDRCTIILLGNRYWRQWAPPISWPRSLPWRHTTNTINTKTLHRAGHSC